MVTPKTFAFVSLTQTIVLSMSGIIWSGIDVVPKYDSLLDQDSSASPYHTAKCDTTARI